MKKNSSVTLENDQSLNRMSFGHALLFTNFKINCKSCYFVLKVDIPSNSETTFKHSKKYTSNTESNERKIPLTLKQCSD